MRTGARFFAAGVLAALSLTVLPLTVLSLTGCDFGGVGGADRTVSVTVADPAARELLAFLEGEWYSRYGAQKLDGYRIGRVENLAAELAGNGDPAYWTGRGFDPANPAIGTGTVQSGAWYVYYNDMFPDWPYGYAGVVHGINLFPNVEGESPAGVIIIEYFTGCDPEWADFSARRFFGIYYRKLGDNTVQMANAVDLEKLEEYNQNHYTGDGSLERVHYAIECATLAEARAKFTAGTDREFIEWGVVMPQYREASR